MAGFDGKNPFDRSFERDVRAARKKAGRAVAKELRAERIAALEDENSRRIGGGVRSSYKNNAARNSVNKGGSISPRRKNHVKAKVVGKAGSLIFMDTAPIAVATEFGQVRKPKTGKYLFVQDKRRRVQAGEKTFVTKGGAVLAVKPWVKSQPGKATSNNNRNKKPRFVGMMVRSVTIKKMAPKNRFFTIAKDHLKMYRDLIEKELRGGL